MKCLYAHINAHGGVVIFGSILILLTGCDRKLLGLHDTVVATSSSAPALVVVGEGQSNMSSENQTPEFPLDARIKMMYGQRIGPSYAFAVGLANKHPGYRVIVIQCGWGGSPTSYWAQGGVAFSRCVSRIQGAGISKIDFVLFSQGEAEAMDQVADSWTAGFTSNVNAMRTLFGTASTPFIYAQTGTIDPAKWNTTKLQAIQDEQAQLALPHTYMVRTADEPTVDGLHHDYNGNLAIGMRMSEAI